MLRILVVDDVDDILRCTERALRQCRLLNPIHLIHDGEECIRYFEEMGTPAEEDGYLVFLDLIMPVSGLEVLRVISDKGLLRESILVMLSGVSDDAMIQEAYRLGAKSFLQKPLMPGEVLELLYSLQNKILVEEKPDGLVLHWISTPIQRRSSDTEVVCRPGGVLTISV